jgi:hypothetical protein
MLGADYHNGKMGFLETPKQRTMRRDTVDSWAGRLTQAAIDALMIKLQPQAASLPA